MKKNLIQIFTLCYVLTLGITNFASAQCENFQDPYMLNGEYVEICPGDVAFLEVNPWYVDYLWSTGESTSNITVFVPGIYEVTVVDQNGCSGTASATVVETYLEASIYSENTTICEGESTTLSTIVNASSSGFVYNWSTGETASSITVSQGGTYAVTVTDWNGCYVSTSIGIQEIPFTAPMIVPEYLDVCEGDIVTLDAGAGYNTYLWNTGETTQFINVFNSGYYEVTVTGSGGCEGTAGSTINYYPSPYPSIIIAETSGAANDDGIICFGDVATLSAVVGGATGAETYLWSNLSNTQTITVSASGTYNVTVTNEFGCVGESSVFLEIVSETDSYCQNCEIPTNESVEMTSPTTAFFDWDDMPNATFYQVKYRLKGTSAWLTTGTSVSQRTVSNLTTKKYYQYKVRAQCADGSWSDFTDIHTFYTSQCDVPTGVAVSFSDDTRMRVRWDVDPNEIKGKIRYRVLGTTNWTTQNSQDGNNYLWVNNLPANSTIQYRVRSNCNGNDWSAYSPLMTHTLGSPRLGQDVLLDDIQLYPNPAKDVITLEFETKDGEEASIIITDNLGKTILSQQNVYVQGLQREAIDIANLSNGYYFITIRTNDSIETKKFMKMK